MFEARPVSGVVGWQHGLAKRDYGDGLAAALVAWRQLNEGITYPGSTTVVSVYQVVMGLQTCPRGERAPLLAGLDPSTTSKWSITVIGQHHPPTK